MPPNINRISFKTLKFFFRRSSTLLFKLSIGFYIQILCLLLAGVITYLFVILLRMTHISIYVIVFWLIMGTSLAVLAWSRFKNLVFDGTSINKYSATHELAFVVLSIVSTAVAIKAQFSLTLFASGDFSGFIRVSNHFTENSGPWNFGVFKGTEYISPDRILLIRETGPFYPQATHFIVAMTNKALGFNSLFKATRLLTVLLCSSVLPLLLVLLGRSFRQRSDLRVLISLSLMFSIFLTYDLRSGNIPAAIATSLMIFLLVFTISLSSLKQRNISVFFSIFLLAVVHPSASASYFLLYLLSRDWEMRLSLVSSTMIKISKFHWRQPAIVPIILLAFWVGAIAVSEKVTSYTKFWSSFHINPEFDSTLGLELIAKIFRFVLVNFLLFGNFSAINLVVLILVCVCTVLLRLNLRRRIRILEIPIVLIVLSSSLGGATGLLSFAALPSILWYSSPIRVVHLWTILVFYRFCQSIKSRYSSPSPLLTTLFLGFAAYTIHLLAILK